VAYLQYAGAVHHVLIWLRNLWYIAVMLSI
jgi:hypothetical protein